MIMVLVNPTESFVDFGESTTFFVGSLTLSDPFQSLVEIMHLLAIKESCFQIGFHLQYFNGSFKSC